MKKAKECAGLIIDAVKTIAHEAQVNKVDTVVVALVAVGTEVQVGIAGAPKDLIELLARTMAQDNKFKTLMASALELADLLNEMDEHEKCNCPACKLKRINVN